MLGRKGPMVDGDYVRLGVLIPSANLLTEPDIYRMVPPGVTAHFSRMRFTGDSPDEFRRMLDDLPKSCESLSDARMDAYAFACTTGTMLYDDDFDAQVISTIADITGRPATTTAAAVLAAFRQLRVTRVALATPYEDWLNAKECAFLQRNGISITAARGLGIKGAVEKAKQSFDTIYELARSVDGADAEAIFVSCAGLPAVELLDRLEAELGKPVVSSNQATFWQLLRLSGVNRAIPGYGALLEHH